MYFNVLGKEVRTVDFCLPELDLCLLSLTYRVMLTCSTTPLMASASTALSKTSAGWCMWLEWRQLKSQRMAVFLFQVGDFFLIQDL